MKYKTLVYILIVFLFCGLSYLYIQIIFLRLTITKNQTTIKNLQITVDQQEQKIKAQKWALYQEARMRVKSNSFPTKTPPKRSR